MNINKTVFIFTLAMAFGSAQAQLTGAVNNTVNAAGQAGRGGLNGTLNSEQTLGTTVQRGQSGLDLGADSTLNGNGSLNTPDVRKAKDATKDKAKQAKDKSATTVADAKAKTDAKVEATKETTARKADSAREQAQETVNSTDVETSSQASGSANVQHERGSNSGSLDLGLNHGASANAGDHHVEGSADANAQTEMKAEKNSDGDRPHAPSASVHGAHSGSGQAATDRAAGRVEHGHSAQSVLSGHEAGVNGASTSKAVAKVKKNKQQ